MHKGRQEQQEALVPHRSPEKYFKAIHFLEQVDSYYIPLIRRGP